MLICIWLFKKIFKISIRKIRINFAFFDKIALLIGQISLYLAVSYFFIYLFALPLAKVNQVKISVNLCLSWMNDSLYSKFSFHTRLEMLSGRGSRFRYAPCKPHEKKKNNSPLLGNKLTPWIFSQTFLNVCEMLHKHFWITQNVCKSI